MYKPKYFALTELVPKEVYDFYTEHLHEDLAWQLFDENLLKAIDWMRERYGSAVINNWKAGGAFKQSGLRTKKGGYYSKGSMHSVGKAADIKFSKITPQQVEADLRAMMERGEPIPFFTRLEDTRYTTTWVHIDTKPVSNLEDGKIHIFIP